MRAVEGILELIKTIIKLLKSSTIDYNSLSQNTFLIESERCQGKISSSTNTTLDQQVFSASVCLFKSTKYSNGTVDNFKAFIRQKLNPVVNKKPLKILSYLINEEDGQLNYRFVQPKLITGIADFV